MNKSSGRKCVDDAGYKTGDDVLSGFVERDSLSNAQIIYLRANFGPGFSFEVDFFLTKTQKNIQILISD